MKHLIDRPRAKTGEVAGRTGRPQRPKTTTASAGGAASPQLGFASSPSRFSSISLSVALLMAVAFPSPGVAAESPQAKSAEEIARELANPNNSLASLTFKNQFRSYKGDLPGADDQDNYTLLFQPVFPFPLAPKANGGKPNIFVRPAIPLLVDQPVPEANGTTSSWDEVTAIGDIGFDLAYGVTETNGLLWAVGMVGTLPTATDSDVAGKQWRLGPELLLAKAEKWGLWGIFPSHQWDVSGSGRGDEYSFSTTSIQPILRVLPGGGWAVGSSPIMTYDWENEDWTVPINLSVSRTLRWRNTPVKMELEVNHYVNQPDAFGPEWMIGLNVTPVVPNFINNWVRGD